MIKNLTIYQQINTQYRDYALYVLQSRGIPNFYDSLTPVQRLILLNSPSRFSKTIGLVGEVIKTGQYHHGDSSLAGAISKLARPFGCAFTILEGDGFFGSPVNPSPSAPRYTQVRINGKAKNIVEQHQDLNEKNEEGSFDWIHLEVPLGLLTHTVGIAVGYRSNILPRKMEDVQNYLTGSIKNLKPHFKDFSGKVSKFQDMENTWLVESGFEVNAPKRTLRIFDLPPIIRYDGFMTRLEHKLELNGFEYRIENKSQTKCDISITFRGVTEDQFKRMVDSISKISKIIVKEDIVFVKDGGVIEYNSVKEYLDHFKVHLENVRLKRILKDSDNLSSELIFLEAKLKFLNFMMERKRNNQEIIEFLSVYPANISSRLQRIEAIKLSKESVEETILRIKEIKQEIVEIKKKSKEQEKIFKKAEKEFKPVKKQAALGALFEPTQIEGIEIFEVSEDNLSASEEHEEETEV